MAVRILAFDFDNTLADTLPVMSNVVNELLRRRGVRGVHYTPEDLASTTPMRVLRTHLGATIWVGEYLTRFRARLDELTLFPDVDVLIREAAARVPLAIQSSLPRTIVEQALRRLDVLQSFRQVVGYGDAARPKPAPDGIRLICESLAVPLRETLFIGDRAEDIEAARSARALSGVALWSRGTHTEALGARPDYRFERPSDVLRAL